MEKSFKALHCWAIVGVRLQPTISAQVDDGKFSASTAWNNHLNTNIALVPGASKEYE
jgi:hypothetical protein